MKKRFAALTLVALTFMSCSSLNQLQKQTFNDGLYVTAPVAQDAAVEVPAGEIDNLLAESKSSPAYIVASGDTLRVNPGTSVVILDADRLTWGSPWYYNSWYYSPWYSPWYYSSWYYDP